MKEIRLVCVWILREFLYKIFKDQDKAENISSNQRAESRGKHINLITGTC